MNFQRKRPGCFVLMDALNAIRNQFIPYRSVVRSTVLICGLVSMLILQGCQVGPALYQSSFNDYNDAIRKTSDGQMLANLVRMRYLESPVFLQMASISTSFNLNSNVGASAGFPEGAANNYGLSTGAGYSETPTITFSLPESREYYGRLMAPLSANQITMLIEAGFKSEMVMQAAVRRINRLENLKINYSSYPQAPRSYAEFREVFALIKKLNSEGFVELGPGLGTSVWSTPVEIKSSDLSDVGLLASGILAQHTSGGELLQNEKKEWQLHTFSRRLSIRFSPAAVDSPDAQRLRELLNLNPDRSSFPILDLELTTIEKGRAYSGQSPAALDPEATWTEIGLQGRSMMEIMQIASTAVELPTEHIEEGVAFIDPSSRSDSGDVLLAIKSSKDEPSNAILRIKYRDYWFYIEDNDLQSRETFALIHALFAVTGGTVPGANPILTLPVGG